MPEFCDVDGVNVRLLAPDDDKIKEKLTEAINEFKTKGSNGNASSSSTDSNRIVIAIDFTHPTAVNKNADLFNSMQLPFVMGTTGGDREKLVEGTKSSNNFAVIAPNMCKQIVALQAMLERTAKEFPGCFKGYSLDIVESHQVGKADASGTAKAIVTSFNSLRAPDKAVTFDEIKMIREPSEQIKFGVPETALKGHAFHTYTLKSSDDSVSFQFQHNVCGRRTYADGVADAVKFLASKISANSEKRLFNMIDVLEAGAMQ